MLVESEIREKAYRLVTVSAVTFSFVAILAVFITLPMVNNYVNSIYMRVQTEMEFCKVTFSQRLKILMMRNAHLAVTLCFVSVFKICYQKMIRI